MNFENFSSIQHFQYPTKIYWEDTDAAGLVFYANYVKFYERARSEWLNSIGIDQLDLLQNQNCVFVVVETQIQYKKPARLLDEVLVISQLDKLSGASLFFSQFIFRGSDLLNSSKTQIVMVNSQTQKPVRIPPSITSIVQPLISATLLRTQ